MCKTVFPEDKFGISVKDGLKLRKQPWDVRAFKESEDLDGETQNTVLGESEEGIGACESNSNGMY